MDDICTYIYMYICIDVYHKLGRVPPVGQGSWLLAALGFKLGIHGLEDERHAMASPCSFSSAAQEASSVGRHWVSEGLSRNSSGPIAFDARPEHLVLCSSQRQAPECSKPL